MRVRCPVKCWTINPRRWCHDIVPKLWTPCTQCRKSWAKNTQWRSGISQKNKFSKYLDSTFRMPPMLSEHILSSSLFTNTHSFDSIMSYERHLINYKLRRIRTTAVITVVWAVGVFTVLPLNTARLLDLPLILYNVANRPISLLFPDPVQFVKGCVKCYFRKGKFRSGVKVASS
jgi:hypothetical protein